MKISKNVYEEKYGLEDLIWGQVENARMLEDGTLQIFFFVDNKDIVELLEIKGTDRVVHKVRKSEDTIVKEILPRVIDELNKICGEEKHYSINEDTLYYGTKDMQVAVCSIDEIVSLKIDKNRVVIKTLEFKWILTADGPII